MLVIGVDPGKTTGLFVVNLHDGGFTHDELGGVDFGNSLFNVLDLNQGTDTLVGCEKYIITTNNVKTNQPEALEQTGVVKYLCGKKMIPVHLVIKANALKVASNERLRSVGWWGRGYTHANDAARCALAALAQHQPGVFSRLPGVLQL